MCKYIQSKNKSEDTLKSLKKKSNSNALHQCMHIIYISDNEIVQFSKPFRK